MSDWWLFQHTVTTNMVNSVAVFTASTLNFSLLLFTCYKGKELSKTHSLQNALHIATYFTYFGFVFFNISVILISVQRIFESLTCTYSTYVAMIAYGTSRYGVWLFSLMRIHIVFYIEVLQWLGYKKKTLIIVFLILTICFIQNMVILFITSSGMEVYIDGGNTAFCAYILKYMPLVIYMQLADQWCTIGCFLLFFKKMRWINKLQKSLGDDSQCLELKYVLRKFSILLATNLLSSWFLLLFATFTPLGTLASQIDSVINMWTILLFDSRYDKIYKKIFGCIATQKNVNDNNENGNAEIINKGTVTMIIHEVTKPKLNPVYSLSLVKNDSTAKPQLNSVNSAPIQTQHH